MRTKNIAPGPVDTPWSGKAISVDARVENGRIKIAMTAQSWGTILLRPKDIEAYIDACNDSDALDRIERTAMYRAQSFKSEDVRPKPVNMDLTAQDSAEAVLAGASVESEITKYGFINATCRISAEIDMPVPLQAVLNAILDMPTETMTEYEALRCLADRARDKKKSARARKDDMK